MFLCEKCYSHITSECQEGWEESIDGIHVAFHVGCETIPSITSP